MSRIADDHQRCRAYGHRWESIDVTFTPTIWIEKLMCIDCDTVRRDYIRKSTFETKNRTYIYPHGYQIKGGVSVEETRQARRQTIEREHL